MTTPTSPKPSRKHHFIPQFYLAGFTPTGSRDGDLFVLDKHQRTQWKTSPRKAAHKRDFHAGDFGPSIDPMTVEHKLAEFETRWGLVVRWIAENRAIPEGQLFADLMFFIAFMAVRVPRIRDTLSAFINDVSRMEIVAALSSPARQASFRKIIEQQQGRQLTEEEFDTLVQFGLSQQYKVEFEQTWHVQEMLQMGIFLGPMLARRKWNIWIAEEDAPDLICSDNPVAPTWATPMPGSLSPAFATPNTIVSMAITRRIAVVSMLETDLGRRGLDQNGVATVNSMTGLYANKLYSAAKDFVWLTKEHQIGNATELLQALEQH